MKTRGLVWGALLVALLTLCAYIKIPTPGLPVTFSVQMLLLCTLVSEGVKAPLVAVTAYLLMGIMGLPVFSSGGGLAFLLQPSAGFLIGYIPCVAVVSMLRKKGELTAALCGLFVLYAAGIVYFVLLIGFYSGEYGVTAIGACALFSLMLLKDILLIFPVILISRRVKAIKRKR